MAVIIGLGLMISHSISKPLGTMVKLMEHSAEGKIGFEIPATEQKDEVGGPARALKVFDQNNAVVTRLKEEEKNSTILRVILKFK